MSKALLKSTTTVGSMTIISRILGFLRDMVAAQLFGASFAYDAFILAQKIPNFLRRLFAEGAFSQAFVPVLADVRHRSEDDVRPFVSHVFGVLGMILGIITVLGIVFAPVLISVFAPGFDPEGARFGLSTLMLKITFPYLFLISLTAFAAGVLNTYGVFSVPALTPVFLNLSIIGCALFLSPHLDEPVVAMAWGVLIGGCAQLAFQIPFLWCRNLLPRPRVDWSDPEVRRILALMAPALIGVGVHQLNLIVDTAFASFLQIGSVSWLYYADRLMEFPQGVFGVALATVLLPDLSKHRANNDSAKFGQTLDWALRMAWLIGLPASLGLILLAQPMMMTLFQYGMFEISDAVQSAYALIALGIGLVAFIFIKIFASAFYARKNVKTPVKIAVVALIVNVVMNAVLIGPFKHVGLAMATSLSAVTNASLLFIGLWRGGVFVGDRRQWTKFLTRVGIAAAAMSAYLFWDSHSTHVWAMWSAGHRALELVKLILIGGGLYAVVLLLMGMRPKDMLARAEGAKA